MAMGRTMGRAVRRGLDGLYRACGFIAALFLVAVLLIILAQIGARWAGVQFPGSSSYAGYAMAGASFFALAYTLNHGAHIRVSLVIGRLTGTARRVAEFWCLLVATGLSVYFAWYAIKAVQVSRMIRDVSQGQDATPLWIPQLFMAAGTVVLAIAFADHLIRLLLGHAITTDERTQE
jgi:TRAP-type C4-dicarboxylate transport system permease small subunit